MSYNREYLGNVAVSKGIIKLSDIGNVSENDPEAVQEAKSIDGDVPGVGNDGDSIYVGTGFVDGRYAVFGHRNEQGILTSVEIFIDEPEPS